MESIKQISKKYILDDDVDRLMRVLNKLKRPYSKDSVDVVKKHLIEITKIENEHFIEFDNTEKVKIGGSNILSYLEYVLQIYKEISENPNCIPKPVIKIEPNSNYISIIVDDIRIDMRNELVDSIFTSLKNSGLIDNYSVYSSDKKYEKIKKCDYCLSFDEFGFQFYKEFEISKNEKTNNPQKVLK